MPIGVCIDPDQFGLRSRHYAAKTAGKQRLTICDHSGYYNIADMVKMLIHAGGEIALCGTCLDARGIQASECVEGAKRSTMEELAEWTLWADKVLTF